MRNTIRLPADVELLTAFINGELDDAPGGISFDIQSDDTGKFKKIKSLSVMLGDKVLFTITPKERRPATVRPEVYINDALTPGLAGE